MAFDNAPPLGWPLPQMPHPWEDKAVKYPTNARGGGGGGDARG